MRLKRREQDAGCEAQAFQRLSYEITFMNDVPGNRLDFHPFGPPFGWTSIRCYERCGLRESVLGFDDAPNHAPKHFLFTSRMLTFCQAEEILEQRIKYARQTGQTHLHVIVGKGNHSPGHVQKIKPRVEQVCRELGLQYRTEPNAGRMYIDLQGNNVDSMPHFEYPQHQPQHQNYGKPHYESAYPMGNMPNYGGGYPGQQHQQQMQYGGQSGYPGQPQQNMQIQEPQQQQQSIKCCGISVCVVM